MPETEVRAFRSHDGEVPILDWLDRLEDREPRAYAKCLASILRLAQLGNELRRPEADMLRDGIRELRPRVGNVNYRILYFYHGRHAVTLSHGLTKEDVVPPKDIDEAVRRMKLVKSNPDKYTADFELD